MISLVILIVLLLTLLWLQNERAHYHDYPPGPVRFPIVGCLPQVLRNKAALPSITFKRLADIHGDIMFLKMGKLEIVVLSSEEAIREMLNHPMSTGSFQFEHVKDRHSNENRGLIWGEGDAHKILRKFTLRHFHVYFGSARDGTLDSVINAEIEKIFQLIWEKIAGPSNGVIQVGDDFFSMGTVNVFWKLITGKTLRHGDPRMRRWLRRNREWLQSTSSGTDLSDAFPILRDFLPHLMGRTLQGGIHEELFSYAEQVIFDQMENDDANADEEERPTFVHAFMEESRNERSSTHFSREQLVFTILDLILGGSETTSNTLAFGLLYMALNPTVQANVQAEIDEKIGDNEQIDSSMKKRLPYTESTILEILRCSTVIPTPSSRKAIDNFYFKGYKIQKGTALIFNLHALHFNERLWGDPMYFRPERFLTADGTAVDTKVANLLKSFGGGNRICIGKHLAQATMFLFFVSILRRFSFEKIEGEIYSTEPMAGITLSPRPFKVRVVERGRRDF